MRNKIIIVFLLSVFLSHSAFAIDWQLLRGDYKLEHDLIDKHELKKSLEQDLPWAYRAQKNQQDRKDQQPEKKYADSIQVLFECPTKSEIVQINLDFKISFDKDVAPYECTDGGNESNVILTVINAFRMMQAIPFDKEFPWAAGYDNLYEWMKSLGIEEIIVAKDLDFPGVTFGKTIEIKSNNLNLPDYLKVLSSPETGGGAGLLPFMVLLIHEARHTMGYYHTCGANDSNLEEKGAWYVQYELYKMLAENTGLFFVKQKGLFSNMADETYNTRFCDYTAEVENEAIKGNECEKNVDCIDKYDGSYNCEAGYCVGSWNNINYACTTNGNCTEGLNCPQQYKICVQWCVKNAECGDDRFCNQQVGFCADNDDPVWGK